MKDGNLVGKFATINGEDYKDYGLNHGDTVVIAGSGFAPIDEDDNYKFLLVVCKILGDKMDDHGVTALKKHLDILPDDKCDELKKILEASRAANEETGQEETRH